MSQSAATQIRNPAQPAQAGAEKPNPAFLAMTAAGVVLSLATFFVPPAAAGYVGSAGVILALSGWILFRQILPQAWLGILILIVAPGVNGLPAVLDCLAMTAVTFLIAEGIGQKPGAATWPARTFGGALTRRPASRTVETRDVLTQVGVDASGAPLYAMRAVARTTAADKTNVLAILAFVFGVLGGVAAIPLGHIALSQIRRTGESGRGMAVAGLILAYVWTGFIIVYVIFVISVLSQFSSVR